MVLFEYLIFISRKILKKSYLTALLVLFAIYFFISLVSLKRLNETGLLKMEFLDVGQGDAIFIITPGNSRILIDGGPSKAISSRIVNLLPLNDKRIDLIILTHPHADHVTGLTAVLKDFEVRSIIFNPEDYDSKTFSDFMAAVKDEVAKGAKIIKVKTGDLISFGDLKLRVIWDPYSLDSPTSPNLASNNPNDRSIVTEFSYKNFDAFLPGDEEIPEAERMLASVALSPVEVLKVAHHGSRNGLNDNLLNVLKPDLAVISAGKGNSYGHPHPETINLLSEAGTKVLRTDLNGTIEVVSDGATWKVKSQK